MSQATFKVIYDGPAVADGEMDVADLAPALLAIGDFVRASARAVYGEEAQVGVRVKATQEGSFEVLLAMVVENAAAAWHFWKKEDVQAAVQLASFLGLTGFGATKGVIAIVKKLRGRAPVIRSTPRPGVVEIETPSGLLEVDEAVGLIVSDRAARAALERAVAEPLEKEGVDQVAFDQGHPDQTISKAEAEWFRAPLASASDEFVSRYDRAFSIVSLHFTQGKKWRLSDGRGGAKMIAIEDPDFLAKVERNELRFAKGDILICDVVETSRRTATGFKSEFQIIRVKEHRPAPSPQVGLPLGDKP